nr:C40 family peptidase [Actinomycetota bacterium]
DVARAAEAAPTEAGPAEATPVAAPAARYGGAVGIAMQYLGVPYRWGGADPSGFDCSGFLMYVYSKVGVSLPHNAAMQYGLGSPVSKDQLQPGDLVFFNGLGHNGMYIGGGSFIHAPHSGDVVKISNLSDSWYAQTWVGARRL